MMFHNVILKIQTKKKNRRRVRGSKISLNKPQAIDQSSKTFSFIQTHNMYITRVPTHKSMTCLPSLKREPKVNTIASFDYHL